MRPSLRRAQLLKIPTPHPALVFTFHHCSLRFKEPQEKTTPTTPQLETANGHFMDEIGDAFQLNVCTELPRSTEHRNKPYLLWVGSSCESKEQHQLNHSKTERVPYYRIQSL